MLQRPAPRLILASASAARRAVLAAAGLRVRCAAGGSTRRGQGGRAARRAGAADAALVLAELKAGALRAASRRRW